ncbi:hypothetical protein ACP70R_018613 [Stipagrostis hirtigluma subsp. patula]
MTVSHRRRRASSLWSGTCTSWLPPSRLPPRPRRRARRR